MDKPSHGGLWWFTGTFKGQPFDGPIEYDDGSEYCPIQFMASDEIWALKDFEGECMPLTREIVEKGQG